MEKTLRHNFAIKSIEIDVLKKRVHIITYKHVNTENIIALLKEKGYHLIEEN